MSAVLPVSRRAPVAAVTPTPRLALLGTGTVGRAFVTRYTALQQRQLRLPRFDWLANSRIAHDCGAGAEQALQLANAAPRGRAVLQPWAETTALRAGDVLVDATASDVVADWHVEWLTRGVHVVTANKLGQGTALSRAQDLYAARHASGAYYGDSATVGAGLPLLSSVRALVAGGDQIHSIEGVLSGSLAWLFHRYDGSTPFSACVREAMAAGYTEPDPRIDLSGEDVRRKLLILARAAGQPLEAEQVHVESLVPAALTSVAPEAVDAHLETLDSLVQTRWQQACAAGRCLRFVGRVDEHGASVGLRELALDHPLAGGAGTDNRVAISSDRYRDQPLLIQGPGAGAEVTAAALLDDVLRIVAG
ncbi:MULTISPECIES: homoserine dehydrogenase [Xanthomonas]|uniref:homoserine dehydrogenase n=1 Tax=Xanthomonas TaxID=338 RepID=UPI0005AEDF09|nr:MULTISPECIES: homoserine dehydrogenase [Xanthomonas]KIQ29771.1 homoserine dehydrogenase [Xanthomonas campestris]MEB2230673.1 homoserine dehydrogenase [Xanthomonas campestris pv. campestris]